MKIAQICIGRFHHFHLARQLYARGLLKCVYTGYPKSKLGAEGIPLDKIRSFPWVQVPYLASLRLRHIPKSLTREMAHLAHVTLDRHAANTMGNVDVVFALSGGGLLAGAEIKRRGGKFVCDRGSSHIRYQDELLTEEYRCWGLEWQGVDPRKLAREEAEYAMADVITVPSDFVYRSFVEKGVPEAKLRLISYGANLKRFQPVSRPDAKQFTVLFVGQFSLRKGAPYLLEAFARLRHPSKRLRVIGSMDASMKTLLNKFALSGVEFLGQVPNTELAKHYSEADVFVLPSIEEGLAMVQGEALACGCPVIASEHTGGSNLFNEGEAGYIIPIRDSTALAGRLQLLADDPALRETLRAGALRTVGQVGGWDTYGENMVAMLKALCGA